MGLLRHKHDEFDALFFRTHVSITGTPSAFGVFQVSPATHLLVCIMIIIAGATTHSLGALSTLVCVVLLSAAALQLPLVPMIRRSLFLASLFAVPLALPATLRVFSPGPIVLSIGPAEFSQTGLLFAGRMFLRSLLSFVSVLGLLHALGVSGIERGLNQLRVSPAIVAVMRLLWLNIITLARIAKSMTLARTARSLRPQPIASAHQTIARQFAMLLAHTIHRQSQLSRAMTARGFDGTFPGPSRSIETKLCLGDLLSLLGIAIVATAVVQFL